MRSIKSVENAFAFPKVSPNFRQSVNGAVPAMRRSDFGFSLIAHHHLAFEGQWQMKRYHPLHLRTKLCTMGLFHPFLYRWDRHSEFETYWQLLTCNNWQDMARPKSYGLTCMYHINRLLEPKCQPAKLQESMSISMLRCPMTVVWCRPGRTVRTRQQCSCAPIQLGTLLRGSVFDLLHLGIISIQQSLSLQGS